MGKNKIWYGGVFVAAINFGHDDVATFLIEHNPNARFLMTGLLEENLKKTSNYRNLLFQILSSNTVADDSQDSIDNAVFVAVGRDDVDTVKLLSKKVSKIGFELYALYDGKTSEEMRELLFSSGGRVPY